MARTEKLEFCEFRKLLHSKRNNQKNEGEATLQKYVNYILCKILISRT